MLQETRVEIESGRLILLPLRLPPRGPMAEFFAVARIGTSPKRVCVQLDPKTRQPRSFTVRPTTGPKDVPVGKCEATIRGIYPYLYVGDPAFVASLFADANLMARALRASAAPYWAGAFKMGSGEIGVSVRFGGRLAIATLQGRFSTSADTDRFSMSLERVRADHETGEDEEESEVAAGSTGAGSALTTHA